MAYAEARGSRFRVRWKLANGRYNSGVTRNELTGELFRSIEEARQYGEDQEALIRLGMRKERRRITFGELARLWYAGLVLEPNTMTTYRSLLSSHLLPVWQDRWVDEIEPWEIEPWENSITAVGYAPRTAKDARRLLGTILGFAVPRFIDVNPAARKRGQGRKGLRRVQEYQQAQKVWPSPGEAVLIGERLALLGRNPDLFLAFVTAAWCGLRWSELLALGPQSLLEDGMLNVDTKLYELQGFYLGWPKDGSIRPLDLPPFLLRLLTEQAGRARRCTCRERRERPPVDGAERVEWCKGQRKYLFLTPGGTHYTRGTASALMRPAAGGVYPGRKDAHNGERPPKPVLADVAVYGPAPPRGRPQVVPGEYAWPGRPVHIPWPAAVPGEEFVPPRGRGRPDWPRWPEAERPHLVSWRPILPGITWHGARHGAQTWMDDAGIKRQLKVERMGHVDASMSARYGHVTEGMREEFREAAQAWWENAIAERFALWPTSLVPALDAELARWRDGTATKTVSQFSPRNRSRARSA